MLVKKYPHSYVTSLHILLLISFCTPIQLNGNQDDIISKGVELFIAATIGSICTATASALWSFLAKPPVAEYSKIEEREQLFKTRQQVLEATQQNLLEMATVLQMFGPHLELQQKKSLEEKLLKAAEKLKKAELKFKNTYKPQHTAFVQNL